MKNLLRTLFPTTRGEETTRGESVNAPIINDNHEAACFTTPSDIHDDGMVSIQNDQIVVTNPEGIGSFATLWIPDDSRVTISINGNKTVGETLVTQADTIAVLFDGRDAIRTFTVKVAEDKLSVSVKANVTQGREIHLVNDAPSRKAVIALEERVVLPTAYPMQDLFDLVQAYGFMGQMDHQALNELCRCTATTEMVVVRGTAPKAAIPGSYRPVNLVDDMDHQLRTRRYATVSIGTTIAIYEPGLSGVSGVDVFGQEILAPSWDKVQALGNGVVQVNNYVVATRSGRPVFTKKKIDVVPELLVNHDLTPAYGPIIFDGCVVIGGSVLDGAYVKATGSVVVYGNASQATILGEEGVYITGNVIGSKIWSGHSQILYADLLGFVRDINGSLKHFYSEYKAITSRASKNFGASNKIHMLPDLLLKERHSSLEQRLHTLDERYSEYLLDTDKEYRTIVEVLRQSWKGIYRTNITHEDIVVLMNLLKEYQRTLEISRTGTSGSISVSEVSNSTLQASGNIIVRGKGAFSSALESGDTVKVSGIVRGGFVIAAAGVSVGELGSPHETETVVRVKREQGIVSVKVRHPNTVIDVGGFRHRNIAAEKNVRLGEKRRGDKISARR